VHWSHIAAPFTIQETQFPVHGPQLLLFAMGPYGGGPALHVVHEVALEQMVQAVPHGVHVVPVK